MRAESQRFGEGGGNGSAREAVANWLQGAIAVKQESEVVRAVRRHTLTDLTDHEIIEVLHTGHDAGWTADEVLFRLFEDDVCTTAGQRQPPR